jgi:hypothetical protein
MTLKFLLPVGYVTSLLRTASTGSNAFGAAAPAEDTEADDDDEDDILPALAAAERPTEREPRRSREVQPSDAQMRLLRVPRSAPVRSRRLEESATYSDRPQSIDAEEVERTRRAPFEKASFC